MDIRSVWITETNYVHLAFGNSPINNHLIMRKIAIIIQLFVLVVSCTKSNDLHTFYKQNETATYVAPRRSSVLSYEDIDSFVRERKGGVITRNSDEYDIKPITHAGNTIMYLVNYTDGWELLSGDIRLEPIIAYCASGNITEKDLFSNPAQSDVFNGLAQCLDSLVSNPVEICENIETKGNPTPPHTYYDSDGRWWVFAYRYLSSQSTQTQNPLTGLKWGQGYKSYPLLTNRKWNICMPYRSPSLTARCYAGCSPVAGAQVLVYLHNKYGTPASFYKNSTCSAYLADTTSIVTLNTSNTTFSNYGNYWSLLPSEGNGASDDQFIAASSLLLHMGKLTGANYKYHGTAAGLDDIKTAFSTYGYNSTLSYNYIDIFRTQIYVNKLPIIVRIVGQRVTPTSTTTLDHAVVPEGYQRSTEVYTYVYKNGDSGTFEYQTHQYTFTYDYVSVNWGYDGDGEYNSSGDVIWHNLNSVLYRTFSNGTDTGTITEMLYGFTKK